MLSPVGRKLVAYTAKSHAHFHDVVILLFLMSASNQPLRLLDHELRDSLCSALLKCPFLGGGKA